MNRFSFTLALIVSVFSSSAQQVEWIFSNPIKYNMNPGMVFQTVTASENGNVICSRLDTSHIIYSTDVLGKTIIECLDFTGQVLWSFVLSDSVVIKHMLTDGNNDIYVAGLFLGNLILNNTDTLNNTSVAAFSENDFLIKLSSSGSLIWSRNLNINFENHKITALACDQQNNLWFSATDFFHTGVFQLNTLGDLNDSIIVVNAKSVSGIDFDDYGSLYICGAAEMGTFIIGSSSFTVPETYVMYIARLNSSFGVEWVYFAHDITFQNPQVKSDGSGGAYFAGHVFDSLSWGSIFFNAPQWGNDFFLVRVDSSGNFIWGRSFPTTSSITGRFTIGSPGNFIDNDPAGNVLLLGTLNGSVDWGNGVQQQGQLSVEKLHVISFDKNNGALWQKTGGGLGNYPTSISVSIQNEVYFTGAVSDTCTFDTIMVNAGNNLATVVVKINPSSVGMGEIKSQGVLVYPNPAVSSVFLPDKWAGKIISIYGMDGRLIKSISSPDPLLFIEGLATGNYLLQCEGQFSRLAIVKD